MKKTYAFLGLMFISVISGLAIIFWVVLTAGKTVDAARSCSASFSQAGPYNNRCDFEVKSDSLDVHYKVNLSQGSLSWKLVAGDGQTVWQSKAEAGEPLESQASVGSLKPGRYALYISVEGATGEYEFLPE